MNAHNKRLAAQAKRRRSGVRALRRKGYSVKDVAQMLTISRARVYQLLSKKP